MNKRVAELVLAIIGGVLGIIVSILVMIGGSFLAGIWAEAGEAVAGVGLFALIASAVGIAGGIITAKNGIIGGILMLIGAVAGFVFLSWIYIISAVLLLIGGLLGIFRKSGPVDNTVAK